MSDGGLSEAARRELLPTGALRLAVNVANAEMAAERSPGTYEGKAIDLVRRLAADWGIAVEIVPFASGGAILADMGAWDAAVLAVEPSRLDRLHFSPAFATVDATLATVGPSPVATCRGADAKGVRIAVVRGAAYTAHLEASMTEATLVAFDRPKEARAAMLGGACDFVAGIRSTLEGMAGANPSVRLMDDDFLRVPQALAIALRKPHASAALDAWMAGAGPAGARA
ncbi:type 2 periplasmic-binding domain-containing protein [Aureimonas ureilytica]|uniref:transporter substrate-binding domain-containing protein n=1 Tax=Aureimonas ureilytica TaxID=401562 RepID=UPI00037DC7B3|nr:transporter substrate-binding domain-containing protein [Aureimonas ureilytica]